MDLVVKQQEQNILDLDWIDVKSQLENFIESVRTDPLCQTLVVNFKRFIKDSDHFMPWIELQMSLRFPMSIGYGNRGGSVVEVNGIPEKYLLSHITIRNDANKFMDAHNFPCKYYLGNKSSGLNTPILYEALAHAGISKEDFEGKYENLKNKIYVKEEFLRNSNVKESAEEMGNILLSTLQKKHENYLLIIISLDKQLPFNLTDLITSFDKRSFYKIVEPLKTINDYEGNRIYYVFKNELRTTLDLHNLSPKEAHEKVEKFIREKYDNFDRYCSIIPGRGNHTNSGGTSGVLKKKLRIWLHQNQIYVRKFYIDSGGGMFKIELVEPNRIILKNDININEQILSSIVTEQKNNNNNNNNNCRLEFKFDEKEKKYIEEPIDIIIAKAIICIPFWKGWPKDLPYPHFYVGSTGLEIGQLIWGYEPCLHSKNSKFAQFIIGGGA